MHDNAFTAATRLCDDAGWVSTDTLPTPNVFAPGLTYLGQINNLRAATGLPPVDETFRCTGSAHLACEHIRCTSPAHDKRPERSDGLLAGCSLLT